MNAVKNIFLDDTYEISWSEHEEQFGRNCFRVYNNIFQDDDIYIYIILISSKRNECDPMHYIYLLQERYNHYYSCRFWRSMSLFEYSCTVNTIS